MSSSSNQALSPELLPILPIRDIHDKVIELDMMVRHILIVPLSMRYSTFSLALAAAPPSTSGQDSYNGCLLR